MEAVFSDCAIILSFVFFRVAELDFIQFSEVVNHDDFFFHEEGRIHVRDQLGYYIIYDIAMKDFESVGTNF